MRLTEANLRKLTQNDREEVEGFQELLRDMGAGLTGDALWDKYGEDYLGPKPAPAATQPQQGGSDG